MAKPFLARHTWRQLACRKTTTPIIRRRQGIHNVSKQPRRSMTGTTLNPRQEDSSSEPQEQEQLRHRRHGLGKLPLVPLLRSILMQTLMSQVYVVDTASALIKRNMKLLTGNTLFKCVGNKTFYAQFCAGETESEIQRTLANLRSLGYKGAILTYAKEVEETRTMHNSSVAQTQASHQAHVDEWLKGTLRTIQYTGAGGFVGIKYTGAGPECVRLLGSGSKPDGVIANALDQICATAEKHGARLLVDAEHHVQQKAIDSWTLELMKRCNRDGKLVVYNTYQMYLKESTAILDAHLQFAEENGFNLGIKLVRGAYIGSDPRQLIHDTKESTDNAYDTAARMLATRHVENPSCTKIGLVLATHNAESIKKMRDLRQQQLRSGLRLTDLVYAQLMGMADELSLSLTEKRSDLPEEDIQVVKYVVWGSMKECMMYLLRRAEENRDAVGRTREAQRALWQELWGRILPNNVSKTIR
ncbi:hypothetical protein AJ80_04820 [Polytolypa hystricis UAMH7299]|uniref:Proline dehydrogenase n=1 Tax=Polytolypa hystricis (strain UAMH7299) TaxID=1447883 RepID=A0A2B7Y8C3_POLH7|nr:hypothetical protein AJ80_04820 [Polytolypa hystricis UAMH7299]